MKRLRSFLQLVTTALLATGASSCFAVTDLDRFEQKGASSASFADLRLTVKGMTSHVAELFEYRVVDKNDFIQSRGIVQPLGGVEATLFVPGAVPIGEGFKLDFYADHDKSGGYTQTDGSPGAKDHAWRIPFDKPPNDDNVFVVDFQHNTVFSLLATPTPSKTYGTDAVVRLVNTGPLTDKRVEVRIADASTKHIVGLYRIPAPFPATSTPFVITIPGMIEDGVTYDVAVYTDDGKAGAGSVKSFRIEKIPTNKGLDVQFDPATAPVVTDVPSP